MGQESGYFGKYGSEVITSPSLRNQYIDFKKLNGYWEYQQEVARMYQSNLKGWMTPVEIFAPFYSHAIARHILESYCGDMNGTITTKPINNNNHPNDNSNEKVKTRKKK